MRDNDIRQTCWEYSPSLIMFTYPISDMMMGSPGNAKAINTSEDNLFDFAGYYAPKEII